MGAATRDALRRIDAPERLIRAYGTEASAVVALGATDPALAAPVAAGTEVTGAELVFGAVVEGAITEADLLERRTRLSLIPEVAAAATGPRGPRSPVNDGAPARSTPVAGPGTRPRRRAPRRPRRR